MFDTKLQIEDFEFYEFFNNGGSDYSFELRLADDTILEAQINFGTQARGRDTFEYIDFIEVASEHNLDDDEQEEIELLLEENINEIFRTAQQIS